MRYLIVALLGSMFASCAISTDCGPQEPMANVRVYDILTIVAPTDVSEIRLASGHREPTIEIVETAVGDSIRLELEIEKSFHNVEPGHEIIIEPQPDLDRLWIYAILRHNSMKEKVGPKVECTPTAETAYIISAKVFLPTNHNVVVR